jgi:DNA ligase-1
MMVCVLLSDLARTSDAVGATRSRTAKTDALAAALSRLQPDEIEAGVAFLSGELRQRQIGVGWAAIRDVPAPATGEATLTVHDVDTAFERIGAMSGPGSQAARRQDLHALFARATPDEQTYLRRLLGGDLRQGALEGLMVQALAKAADTTTARVQRAFMLRGDLASVAHAALTEGPNRLDGFTLEVGRPVRPMLARPAKNVDDALAKLKDAPAAAETKLDGARIQVHRDGGDVAIFTRSLDDVTTRLPEIVAAARALPLDAVVLDGEAIALQPGGRPHPFQVTASRFATTNATDIQLSPFFFDVLHLDGHDSIDLPGRERAALLAGRVPEEQRVPRDEIASAGDAQAFLDRALDQGHEGIMLKALDAPYAAGSRGAGWLKVKPVHTLDLVVLAAEWGHGRRQGRLSNLHLGARDASDPGRFVMLGKTFKGLTDEMLAWQTQRLLELETNRTRYAVHVRPELVVEIAFDGIQTSPRYPGGVALRFARVIRHRPDKTAAEADTLDAVLAVAR